jgi:HEAT repeat protein
MSLSVASPQPQERHPSREAAEVERNRGTHVSLNLTDEVDYRRKSVGPTRELGSAELRARSKYLKGLQKDVQNRLSVSIHKARFLDLGIADTPSATHTWIYKNTNSLQEFTDIAAAFATYERRLLLLGAPGSGKTVSLLHIAEQLIREAEDPSAPIPLLVNLSNFQIKKPPAPISKWQRGKQSRRDEHDMQIEDWLIEELTNCPHVSEKLARKWIKEGRIAALLDGLDEVNDEYRAALVQLLNTTYLRDYPEAVVVLCSRINEYLPLQDRQETTINLEGGVTLQPLNPTQIREYLEKAKATGLAEAIIGNERLTQMAQTPLTLSMLTLAYSGTAPSNIPSYSSLTEQRLHLMECYVDRMLQREERRIHDKIIYDEDPKSEVPIKQYAYPPEKLKNYLGWLAVRLSVRSQTAFSTHGLFNLLIRDLDRDRRSDVWWILTLCRAALLFLLLLLTSTAVAPMTTDAWFRIFEVSLFGTAAYVLVAWASSSDFELSDALESILGVSLLLVSFVAVAAVLGIGTLALSSILPFNIPSLPMVIIVSCMCGSIAVGMFHDQLNKPRGGSSIKSMSLTILVMFVTFLTALTAMRITGREDEWYIPAVALAVVLMIQIVIKFRGEGWKMALTYLIFPLPFFLVPVSSAGLIGELTWYLPMVLFGLAAALVLSSLAEPLLCLAGLFLCFVLGSLVGGVAGAVITSITYGYLLLLWVIYNKKDEPKNDAVPHFHNFIRSVSARCEKLGDRYLLSPILLCIMVITRRLPWRFMRFFRYTERALLLKRSAGDFEFMHRLLRDYFALRDLQSLLREQHSGKRLQAIRSLGFQGDAAIDAVAEFLRLPDADTREAAAEALGRIASPEVVQHVEAAVQDPEPRVRRTAVISTKNFTMQDRVRCLLLVMEDRDLSVQRALLEVALGTSPHLPVGFWEPFDLYVFEHVRDRDDLKHIIFQIVETRSENRLRASAINFVSELKDPQAVPALRTAMLDTKFPFYFMAAVGLAKIQDPQAVKYLIDLARQRDKERRMIAVKTLRKFDTPEAIEAAEKFSRRL